jgi:hypothetical protein
MRILVSSRCTISQNSKEPEVTRAMTRLGALATQFYAFDVLALKGDDLRPPAP